MKVSFFQSVNRPAFFIESAPREKQYVHFAWKNVDLEQIFKAIRDGKYSKHLELAKTGRGTWEENKRHLPCFTPSGTFRIRCDWDLISYSHVVQLDYDNLSAQLFSVFQRVTKSPYCLAAFVSPSGNGIKVFVKVNSGPDEHYHAWSQVRKVFDDLASHKSDSSVSNISRLCFVSVDDQLYYNDKAKVFEVSPDTKTSVTIPDQSLLADADSIFGYLYNLTLKGKYQKETLQHYGKGKRNNFLFVFACNCNRFGIDKTTALDFVTTIWIKDNMGFSEAELSRTVDSAYSYAHEHASFRLPKTLKS